MEITMYEDNSFSRENVAQMKRKFTLDLNGRSSKKFRTHGQVNFNPLLTSPDLNMLKLASPELDKLVLQQGCILPNGFNFPAVKTSSVNSEDYASSKNNNHNTVSSEEFVKGFQDTLEQFHHNAPESIASTVPTTISSSSEMQYTQLEVQPTQQQVPVTSACGDDSMYIKEEPQIVPNVCSGTPPVSPINMEAQEKIKLERKRLRNRIAASKCRRRKLERISKLEDKVSNLKAENSELQAVVNRMKDQVCSLKQEVMEHVNSGCEIPFLSATQCQ